MRSSKIKLRSSACNSLLACLCRTYKFTKIYCSPNSMNGGGPTGLTHSKFPSNEYNKRDDVISAFHGDKK